LIRCVSEGWAATTLRRMTAMSVDRTKQRIVVADDDVLLREGVDIARLSRSAILVAVTEQIVDQRA
jgi:hypothetical protein